jgi:hypothetical protein
MRHLLMLTAAAVALSSIAEAAPARKGKPTVRRAAPKPAPKPTPKPADTGPVTPGIMVPKAIVLVRPTPAEAAAHAIWSLRAALNVAALQCQYSPFLRTVDNYNQVLKKHGGELAAAQTQMIGHFTRTQKAGLAAFDRYNTRSYNSFSTLDAQYNFCWAAGQAGQALRTANVGTMAAVAETALPELRRALAYVPMAAGLAVPPIPPFPDFTQTPITFTDE